MKRKVLIITVVVVFVLILAIAIIFINLLQYPQPHINLSERKAFIVGSANDFYDSEVEEDYSGSNDATFINNQGNWTFEGINSEGSYEPTLGNTTIGSLYMKPTVTGLINGNFILNYSKFYDLDNYAFYNLTASIYILNPGPIVGKGVSIGLQWMDSSDDLVKIDWSNYSISTPNIWLPLSVNSVCNNETENEINELNFILSVEGIIDPASSMGVYFDDLRLDKWISVNFTNPTNPNPPPTKADSDGFPAQALHVYWILKNHGYTDENIFFMLYHTNDNIIDIKAGDGILNDLTGAVIDVENNDVNASRFKHELNTSISGSFASEVDENDKLIIFMVDHGSNKILGDGNATFHFEADNSFITEFEFFDLVKELEFERLMINVDCCFSGNFLCKDKNIGLSWYDIPNCIFVSAASNVFSWYWISNVNGDGFAGSWFFHPFWEQLNQNHTIANAFNIALGFVPFNRFIPVIVIQMPLMYDNMGINNTLSFNSDPPL